jgi:hypothetical protein
LASRMATVAVPAAIVVDWLTLAVVPEFDQG